MAFEWDCYLYDETGANPIPLIEEFQPRPIPVWRYSQRKSDHEFIAGEDSPGDTELQRLGWGPGRTRLILPRIPRAFLDQIAALYFRFADGAQKSFQLRTPDGLWLCSWDSDWDPKRRERRPERYSLELDIVQEEEVEE
jgi:hypothetical protein